MTALSNIFAWFWLLFPGGPQLECSAQQPQPCSAETQVSPPDQERTSKKASPFRHFWKSANPNGISNGI